MNWQDWKRRYATGTRADTGALKICSISTYQLISSANSWLRHCRQPQGTPDYNKKVILLRSFLNFSPKDPYLSHISSSLCSVFLLHDLYTFWQYKFIFAVGEYDFFSFLSFLVSSFMSAVTFDFGVKTSSGYSLPT